MGAWDIGTGNCSIGFGGSNYMLSPWVMVSQIGINHDIGDYLGPCSLIVQELHHCVCCVFGSARLSVLAVKSLGFRV